MTTYISANTLYIHSLPSPTIKFQHQLNLKEILLYNCFWSYSRLEHDSGTLVEQEGQEEERMEGIEGPTEVQIGITGDIQVQGPVFSPRKTRSGRVVKYKANK